MAERLLCPKCGRPSYTAATAAYLPCPHCGCVFSKAGPSRRERERVRKELSFALVYSGRSIPSRTVDICGDRRIKGLRISVEGIQPLKEGETLTLDIPQLGLRGARARVVWKALEGENMALGLSFL